MPAAPTATRTRTAPRRAASTGTARAAGRPVAANSDSSAPASSGEDPAVSWRITGSQAKSAYALKPETANTTASAHASGDRNARRSRPGSASSGNSAGTSRRGCTSRATHGTIESRASTAHDPSETRQPAASATGTATSGGRNVLTDIAVT